MEAVTPRTRNKGCIVCREFKSNKTYEKSSDFYFQHEGKQLQ